MARALPYQKCIEPTKKRVERLADLINAQVLKTNIWCVEAGSGKHLTRADRSTAVFEMLLEQIRPAVVVAHGSKATSLLGQMSIGAQVIAVPHLSRLGSPKGFGWSDERLQQRATMIGLTRSPLKMRSEIKKKAVRQCIQHLLRAN